MRAGHGGWVGCGVRRRLARCLIGALLVVAPLLGPLANRAVASTPSGKPWLCQASTNACIVAKLVHFIPTMEAERSKVLGIAFHVTSTRCVADFQGPVSLSSTYTCAVDVIYQGTDAKILVTIGLYDVGTELAWRVTGSTLVSTGPTSSSVPTRKTRPATALRPLVLSAYAKPAAVGPHGGQVTVYARLKDAATCQLELLSRQGFPVVYASNVRPCSADFGAHITIGANTTAVERHVAFGLVARNGAQSSTGRFWVNVAPGKSG